MGACLGSGRAKFECILYGLGGLDGSPEGWTGGSGMGRTARAGVRVGLFACLCLCRERPPCEGFIPSVTAEGPAGFPECAVCSPWRHGQGSVASRVSTFVQKNGETRRKQVVHTSFRTNQPTGEFGCGRLGPSGGPIELSSDRYWSFATAGSVWLNRGLSIETSGQPFELKVASKLIC